jgi:hypothetical protein
MLSLIQKFGPAAAGVILIWYCWSNIETDDKNEMKKKPPLPTVPSRLLVMRAPDQEPIKASDPFDWGTQKSKGAPTTPSTKVRAKATRSFKLELDAVLDLPGTSQARINGYSVPVGSMIPECDPENPPLLVSVKGTRAVVFYMGESYVLDMYDQPVADIRPRASALEESPAGGGAE